MATLKERKATYEFSLEDIKNLIAEDLNVSPSKVTVRYVLVDTPDDFGLYPTYDVGRIDVTVSE